MNELSRRLRGGEGACALTDRLNGLDHDARLAEVHGLSRRDLALLYEAAEGAPCDLDHFVPRELGPGRPVRHHGLNSLLAFRIFEKRFMRAETGEELLWGYNHQTLQPLTGPGYFVVDPPEQGREAEIDYLRVPSTRPACSWPPVAPNTGPISRLVYGGMRDRMRRVSEQVSVGRAFRGDQPMRAWFVLVRED